MNLFNLLIINMEIGKKGKPTILSIALFMPNKFEIV